MKRQNKKQIYNLTAPEIAERLGSSMSGLPGEEAKKRLKESGRNEIRKTESFKWLKLLGSQFNDALVWILLAAATLAFAFSEMRDVTIILIIVLVNALIGFFQEFKAERILESMEKLTSDKATVLRDGAKVEIESREIVPGDIVIISSGDNVPADGLLLEGYDLRVNSFIFTGESKPKAKKEGVNDLAGVPVAEITNMVFMGETVATGEAKFMVSATGMDTELGRLAHLTQNVKDDPTPMQKQMRTLGRNVTILSVFIGAIVLIAGQYFKMSLYENFLFALALAVSVVPEGLPAAVSVALSLGMKRLLKGNVLAKKLNAVETLGSVSIICSDKTGTITKNELTVVKVAVDGKQIDLTGVGYEPKGDFEISGKKVDPSSVRNLGLLMKIGTLCNDAALAEKNGNYSIIGDPTEGAIIVAGRKFNSDEDFYLKGERKIIINPFTSERMMMSAVYRNGRTISYVKGSPDVMIDRCDKMAVDGKIFPFSSEEKEKARETFDSMSREALRVLAFAYRDLEEISEGRIKEEAEKKLVWVGTMAMIDPPRHDVAEAIIECKNLGLKPIMITGDYEITAEAIARDVNLIGAPGTYEIISGRVLDSLSDRQIYQHVKSKDVVFARIAPEQKLRIATILKNNKQVIAMTGDGVNDAPALKKADIGVAMGIIGTDVSKEAADMILLDDNFASIVKGVKEGRMVFSNLKKFIHYVFTSNASELITVLFGVLLQIPSPISAIQILAVDLGTDIFPSFALGLEPEEPRQTAGDRKAANSSQSVMSLAGFRRIIYLGIIMATGATVAFIWSMVRGGWNFGEKIDAQSLLYIKSTTAAYAVLAMAQLANMMQSRSERLSPFALGFFKNIYAIIAMFMSVTMFLLFMYVPVFQYYLQMAPIDWKDWLVVGISFLAVFLWEEGRKEKLN